MHTIPATFVHLGVSKNRGTSKWMVYRENPIKMDDLGVPLFLETPTWKTEEKKTWKRQQLSETETKMCPIALLPRKSVLKKPSSRTFQHKYQIHQH